MDDRAALDAALERAAAAEATAAEYALALDILGRLAGVTSEDAVADVVLEFAQLVLGAARARLITLDRWGRASWAWTSDASGGLTRIAGDGLPSHTARTLEVTASGIHVPIVVGDRLVAHLDLEDLAVPGEAGRYGNTVLTIARVAAMALAAARATHGLVPICASCRSVRDRQGAWHPLERWLSATSEVQFSHGLCPSCLVLAEREAGLAPERDTRG